MDFIHAAQCLLTRDLGGEVDGRGQRIGDEATVLGLFEHPQHFLFFHVIGNADADSKMNFGKLGSAINPLQFPCCVAIQCMPHDSRRCGDSAKVSTKQSATAAMSSASGDH